MARALTRTSIRRWVAGVLRSRFAAPEDTHGATSACPIRSFFFLGLWRASVRCRRRSLRAPLSMWELSLAEHRSIPVVPRTDVRDARTICGPGDTPVIEYNPNRPKARIRFSICHELAHTLFPDCTREVRNRLYHAETTPVSYELEMLCNLAAAEFLLPIGSIKEDLSNFRLSIETALQLRGRYRRFHR